MIKPQDRPRDAHRQAEKGPGRRRLAAHRLDSAMEGGPPHDTTTAPEHAAAGETPPAVAGRAGRRPAPATRVPGARDTRDFSTAPGENPAAGQPNCCPAQPLSTLLLSVAAGVAREPAVERWDAAWGQEGRLGATNRLTDWPFLAFPFLCAEALVVSLSQVMRAHTRGLFRWVHGVATRARDTTQPCTRWELVATS